MAPIKKSSELTEQPGENEGDIVHYRHAGTNTIPRQVITSSVNHTEGGWPKDVRLESQEQKNKFVRKVCKEDMFKWTAAKLSKTMERFIRINNAINIEEIYFQDYEEKEEDSSALKITTLSKLKDYSGKRRPVSSISWRKSCDKVWLAVAHCAHEFPSNEEEPSRDIIAS
ncbi:dynein intermediate chain 3, ciliary [Eurytemora carolleeae]|uniref:dynein intermediate chain 3, ciliary n=1 Tax=Eurytemora carolleeae TaxID=1294199 RepID=UPI000C79188F|nr:dynein intermediate chain 3, ciliary [Eurytemora carolleeae]|eukprot:XP_023322604.1 dynein intermediate chain 3, ciliary-like [Eurytemora affinis]